MLLERRFSLVTTSFAQPLPCGNVHWGRLLCFQPILVSIAVFQRFGVSAQLLSCFQTLCNQCPRPCICCMAPVTWKCGSFSLAVTCTFDRCLDTEIRVLSTTQSRNRTSTESDKYSQMFSCSFFGVVAVYLFSVWCCLRSPALGSGACLLSSVGWCCLVSSFLLGGVAVFPFPFGGVAFHRLLWVGLLFPPVFCCVVPLGLLFPFGWRCCFSFLLFGGVVFLLLWVGLLFPMSSVGWCCLVSSSFFQSCCSFSFSCSAVLPSFASFG